MYSSSSDERLVKSTSVSYVTSILTEYGIVKQITQKVEESGGNSNMANSTIKKQLELTVKMIVTLLAEPRMSAEALGKALGVSARKSPPDKGGLFS